MPFPINVFHIPSLLPSKWCCPGTFPVSDLIISFSCLPDLSYKRTFSCFPYHKKTKQNKTNKRTTLFLLPLCYPIYLLPLQQKSSKKLSLFIVFIHPFYIISTVFAMNYLSDITVNVYVFFTSWLVQVDWLSWVGHLHRWTQAASQLALLLWHLCPQHSASRVTTKWRAGAGAQRNFGAGLLRVGTYPSVHILVSENWVPGPQHNFKGGWKMSQCAQKKDMDKPVFC